MQIVKTNKTAVSRAGLKNGNPKRYGQLVIFVVAAVLIAFAAAAEPVFAADELLLTGIVKTIDPKTGLVFVDVGSESCPGIRRFYADDLNTLGKYVNKEITFRIDSSTCRDTAIHTILVSRGINK
jgi:hypothetical protein